MPDMTRDTDGSWLIDSPTITDYSGITYTFNTEDTGATGDIKIKSIDATKATPIDSVTITGTGYNQFKDDLDGHIIDYVFSSATYKGNLLSSTGLLRKNKSENDILINYATPTTRYLFGDISLIEFRQEGDATYHQILSASDIYNLPGKRKVFNIISCPEGTQLELNVSYTNLDSTYSTSLRPGGYITMLYKTNSQTGNNEFLWAYCNQWNYDTSNLNWRGGDNDNIKNQGGYSVRVRLKNISDGSYATGNVVIAVYTPELMNI